MAASQMSSGGSVSFAWWRRLQLLLTVGGGFAGLCVVLQGAITAGKMPLLYYIVISFFALLYCLGIFAGIRYSEQPDNWLPLFLYHAIQVPLFTSPLFSYIFASGFLLSFGFGGGRLGFSFALGSSWMFTIAQTQPWSIGLNIFAITMVIALLAIHSTRVAPTEPETNRPRVTEDPY